MREDDFSELVAAATSQIRPVDIKAVRRLQRSQSEFALMIGQRGHASELGKGDVVPTVRLAPC